MPEPTIANVAEGVLRRAQRQGYVVPSEIRTELETAGLASEQWKTVVAHLKDDLHYRQGRYYHVASVSPRLHLEQQRQQAIGKVIKSLIKEHKDAARDRERRGQMRVDFIQPVKVRTEDGNEYTLMSRDLSTTGVRLIGVRRLLGQKIHMILTTKEGAPVTLVVRILWTCAVGDDLFENGGNFLELIAT